MTSDMVTAAVTSVCHVEVIHASLLTKKSIAALHVIASCDLLHVPFDTLKTVSALALTGVKHAVCTTFHLVNTAATCVSATFVNSGCPASIFVTSVSNYPNPSRVNICLLTLKPIQLQSITLPIYSSLIGSANIALKAYTGKINTVLIAALPVQNVQLLSLAILPGVTLREHSA